jgi:60 kDa SS-A/Ro ribonucleoprotein
VRLNTLQHPVTHEGAKAAILSPEQQLRRTLNACLLWENTFYEDGVAVEERIRTLVPRVTPEFAAAVAYEARTKHKLRHAPLLLVREMARNASHRRLVSALLADVIQRPDEITEFLAIYWKDKRQPLSAQVKKGLAKAFQKFNEYQLAKYDRDGPIKLRDALFLCHSRPKDSEQEALYRRLVDRNLATPDTWEVNLSAGKDKREIFEALMSERKLGALAFIRNLRNMYEAGVPVRTVEDYGATIGLERVLPFRFIAAARAVPAWSHVVEPIMLRCLDSVEKLQGKTAIVIDNSESMYYDNVSARSELTRSDAACALAILLREVCADVLVIGFGSDAMVIPAYRGFALAEAIQRGPGGGTYTQRALKLANLHGYDRIILVTDEQSHESIEAPLGNEGYVVNVANYRNGIGYGAWTHIDGWSESIIDYIRA